MIAVADDERGSTIAKILAENTREHPDVFEEEVQMWVFEEEVTIPKDSPHREALGDQTHKLTDIINRVHENVKYLPGTALPSNVVANPDLRAASRTPRSSSSTSRTSSSTRHSSR